MKQSREEDRAEGALRPSCRFRLESEVGPGRLSACEWQLLVEDKCTMSWLEQARRRKRPLMEYFLKCSAHEVLLSNVGLDARDPPSAEYLKYCCEQYGA